MATPRLGGSQRLARRLLISRLRPRPDLNLRVIHFIFA